MTLRFERTHSREIRMPIMQGEARASADQRVIMSTVLGSCVATCLYDPVAKIGGMNHFLLAEPPEHETDLSFDSSYGLFLMELLVNEMLKLGALKSRMKARLYGGANMASVLGAGLGRIGSANAAFARRFLHNEGIETVFEDLEGTWARRIEFSPVRGLVRARRIAPVDAPDHALTPRFQTIATGNPQGAAQAPIGDVELF